MKQSLKTVNIFFAIACLLFLKTSALSSTKCPVEKDMKHPQGKETSFNEPNKKTFDSFVTACQKGDLDKVKSLDLKAIDINGLDERGRAPVHYAADDIDILSLLLGFGADPNRVDFEGRTALHYLALQGDIYVRNVSVLLENGANSECPDRSGLTPVELAIGSNISNSIVQLMLNYEADVFRKDNHGNSLLHQAAVECNPWAVSFLIKKGIPVDCPNKSGATPLMFASYSGCVEAIDLLLAEGANVNQVNELGLTALFFSVNCDDLRTVDLLLKKGADPAIKDKQGKTVVEMARENKRFRLAEHIVDRMKNSEE